MKRICCFIILLILGIVGFHFLTLQGDFSVVQAQIRENPINSSNANVVPKLTDYALTRTLKKLENCESGGNPDAVHENDGGSDSYGILQFKRLTFELFWRKLINPNIEDLEIDNIWKDPESQILLAKKMLENNFNNWKQWYNCGKKIGLDKL